MKYFFFTKKQELGVVCIMNTKIEEAEWQKNKLTFHIIVFMYYVHVTSSDHVIWRQFIPLLTCQRPLFKFLDCLLLLKKYHTTGWAKSQVPFFSQKKLGIPDNSVS